MKTSYCNLVVVIIIEQVLLISSERDREFPVSLCNCSFRLTWAFWTVTKNTTNQYHLPNQSSLVLCRFSFSNFFFLSYKRGNIKYNLFLYYVDLFTFLCLSLRRRNSASSQTHSVSHEESRALRELETPSRGQPK